MKFRPLTPSFHLVHSVRKESFSKFLLFPSFSKVLKKSATSVFGTHFRDSFFGTQIFPGLKILRDSKFYGTQNFTGLKSSSAHILPKSNFSEIQNLILLSRLLFRILVVLRINLANHFEGLIWSISIDFVSLFYLFYPLLKHD